MRNNPRFRDLFGLSALAHPNPRRLSLHQFWPVDYYPLLKDAAPPTEFVDDGTPYPFRRVEGEDIHEISVGPVDAGTLSRVTFGSASKAKR